MRKRLFFFTATCILLSFSASYENQGEVLVLIERAGDRPFSSLSDYPITPHFKGEGWILSTAPFDVIELMRRAGFAVKVLDNAPWSEPYFLVTGPEGGVPACIPANLRLLASVREGSIVKGQVSDVMDYQERDLRFIRMHEEEIPLVEKEVGKFKGISPGLHRKEGWIADQVSDSTITEYITRLVDFRTRYSCTDSVEAASQWIYDKFLEFGYTEVSFDSFPFNPTGYPCDVQKNVVAVKPGTMAADKVIVIGGHYDSVSYTTENCDPDTLAPGADDDASGTVVTLEAARVLASINSDCTLIFVAFGAEEQWMWGSYHFVEDAFAEDMDIKVMMNLDMISYLADEYMDISVEADSSSGPFAEAVAEIGATYTDLIPILSIGAFAPGDNIPFYEYGYNFVYAQDADWPNPYYHSCFDNLEHISISYCAEVAEMIIPSISYFSSMPDLPTGLGALNIGDGTSLYVSWEPNTELDISGYNIYFGTQPEVYDSLKFALSTGDTLKNLMEETVYYISISAIDADGYESFLTDEIEIETSPKPLTPTDIEATSLDSSIILTWERNVGELDLAGYNIYRRSVGGPPEPTLLGFVPDPITTFADSATLPHTLYAYHVRAVDTEIPPEESEPTEEVLGRLATHDQGILVVDATKDGSGAPFSPTDEGVDVFYENLFDTYTIGAFWDVKDSLGVNRLVMDYDIGIYSSIFWHCDIRTGTPMAPDTTTMRKYLAGGGNLWLSGWRLLASLTSESNPHTFEEGEFVFEYIGIDSARTTPNEVKDFIGARGLIEGFPDLSVDSSKVYPLGVLYDTEVLLPPFHDAQAVYAYVAEDSAESEFHGIPVAVTSNSEEYGLVATDFPLYFMETDGAQELVHAVMERFGEPVSVEDEGGPKVPLTFSLSQNYPNPFNPSTTIALDIPGDPQEKCPVSLKIYDVRGRHVRTLLDSDLAVGSHWIVWNGRNENGEVVSSGIYIYVLKSGDRAITRKMLAIR
jgi:hypothetical protein